VLNGIGDGLAPVHDADFTKAVNASVSIDFDYVVDSAAFTSHGEVGDFCDLQGDLTLFDNEYYATTTCTPYSALCVLERRVLNLGRIEERMREADCLFTVELFAGEQHH
tara:strand:- start:143 stop:469 length:327 start_codon:yes stop_codon:yes gene_type:complete